MTLAPASAGAAAGPTPETPDACTPSAPAPGPAPEAAHLTPERWEQATRRLLAKALAEFAHERLLTPERVADAPGGAARYTVTSDDGRTAYGFTAHRLTLDHWHIAPASLTREDLTGENLTGKEPTPNEPTRDELPGGEPDEDRAREPRPPEPRPSAPLDALTFLNDLRTSLALGPDILPVYLEEITATLSSAAHRATLPRPSPTDLPVAGFQAVEAAMTEGHPCFVANSGRLGLGATERRRYTPEAAAPQRLFWLAAHRDHAGFSTGEGVDEQAFMTAELGEAQHARFRSALTAQGLDPAEHVLIPAHPWQWEHKLSVSFAGEIAARRLVPLGPGDDDYLAQQSVRTFFNTSHPHRHYVKTALSVLNMGFMRGLSAAYMAGTPAINDWLAGLIAADPTLTAARFSIIRERAAAGYRHQAYEAATAPGSPYRMMLAALWRESPLPGLAPGESPVTMAALLHTDDTRSPTGDPRNPHGPGGPGDPRGSFAAVLIGRSGLPPARWLRRYLDAYLVPVLHSLYAYGLAYMPHGENVILVLGPDGGTVERAVFKDIAEEIIVMDPDTPLPPAAERIRAAGVPDEERVLAVFTDVFDCFLRFLSAILHTRGVLDERAFWRTVGACVADYQDAHPALAARFARHDLFADRFALSCLNRLQLRNNSRMVDLADPSAALQFAGTLANPLAPHRPA